MSAHFRHEGTRKPANSNLRRKAVCTIPVVVLAMGSPNSVSALPFSAFVASVHFLHDFLIWISFVAFLYGGLPFLVPSCSLLLTFSSTSLLASFSLYCFAVISALFLSSFGLSPWAILSISISSSSGTFCLHILIFALGFMPSLKSKCLLVCALVSISCLCFCPHVLCAIILELVKSK